LSDLLNTRDMGDQRIVRRTLLCLKDLCYGLLVKNIRTEAVDCLGWERDNPAAFYKLSSLQQRICDNRLHLKKFYAKPPRTQSDMSAIEAT